jgi:hypothetical protein
VNSKVATADGSGVAVKDSKNVSGLSGHK